MEKVRVRDLKAEEAKLEEIYKEVDLFMQPAARLREIDIATERITPIPDDPLTELQHTRPPKIKRNS